MIQRFARGVRAVCDAVVAGDTASIVSHAKEGFSANACDQFAKLVENTSPGGLDFSFSFSPEWVPPAALVEGRQFSVGTAHIEFSRAAAKLPRTQFTPRQERVFGRVIRLESDADPSDLLNPQGDWEIAIQWSSEDLGDIQVQVSLGPKEYLGAVEAHKLGRPMAVSGTLEKKGRPYVLSNPTNFGVT